MRFSFLVAILLLVSLLDCGEGAARRVRKRGRKQSARKSGPKCTIPSSVIIVAAGRSKKIGSCFEDTRLGNAIKDCTTGGGPSERMSSMRMAGSGNQNRRKKPQQRRHRQKRFNADVLKRIGGQIQALIPQDLKDIIDGILQGTIAQLVPEDFRSFIKVDMIIEIFTNVQLWKFLIGEIFGGGDNEDLREYAPRGMDANMKCLDQCVFEKAGLLGQNLKPDHGKVVSLLQRHATEKRPWSPKMEEIYRNCMKQQANEKRNQNCFKSQCLASSLSAQCMLDVLVNLCGAIER